MRDLLLVTVLFVVVSLIPVGAHLFELPAKLGLSPSDYMVVQQIYQGWSRFALAIFPAVLLTLASAIGLRRSRRPFLLALLAFLCMASAQAVFWIWTYPANQITENWTRMPPDFAVVRAHWEYSHAVGAGLTFAALLALLGCIRAGSSVARNRRLPVSGR